MDVEIGRKGLENKLEKEASGQVGLVGVSGGL